MISISPPRNIQILLTLAAVAIKESGIPQNPEIREDDDGQDNSSMVGRIHFPSHDQASATLSLLSGSVRVLMDIAGGHCEALTYGLEIVPSRLDDNLP